MDPTARIIDVLDGKQVDRVPVFCALMEDRGFNEVLGQPLIKPIKMLWNPVSRFFLDNFGPKLTGLAVQPFIDTTLDKRIKAALVLGFDSTWAIHDRTFTVLDSKTMVRFSGSIFDLMEDGYGNAIYMYRGPGIKSREDFNAWPWWPDIDDLAQKDYLFMKKMVAKYGDDICLIGQGSAYGIQESMLWAIGFERMPVWIKREKDLVDRYIAWAEEVCMKTIMAIMDAGIKVVIQTDDFAFKTGPMMRPKLIDELFGPSYTRIIKAVHDRGGRYIHHSCGDNTLLFDYFIKWGADGCHGYENTSNVDINKQKRERGDRLTIVGGVGVDYILSERSKDEEVVDEVRRLIKELAPGGRYILSAVHGLSSMPAHKQKVMVDACKQYGNYPISGV
jgi:uroporphyrinogen decarboxylase